MSKSNLNKYISENYGKYEVAIAGIKQSPVSPIVVSERKGNHPASLCKTQALTHEALPENMNVIIEVKECDGKYSISLNSERFPGCILLRYDCGGGTHRNNLPDIPLNEQSVTTPHFHKYNKEGYNIAYKTEKLKTEGEAKALCDIDFGFPYFCQESNIRHRDNAPELKINYNHLFPEAGEDPLESITFA
jgi:hypothetical protein